MSADVITRDGPRPRWRGLLWPAILVLLVIALVAADRIAQHQETRAIIDRVVMGQAAVAYAERRIAATVQYASPALLSNRVSEDVRRSLEGLVQRSAAERATALRELRDATRVARVLPWHGDQRRARDAYVHLLDARISYFESIAANMSALFSRDPALEPAETAARRALLATVSEQADADRVAALFTRN